MKHSIKTKGLVLRRIPLNEADQIVTLLTRDEGRVSLIAKGSRRLKSRFCGRLELLNHLDLNYLQGRDLGYLSEAEILEFWPTDINLKAQGALFYMAEITGRMLPEGGETSEVYELLCQTLRHTDEQSSEIMLYAYIVKLMTLLGFMGSWNTCSRSEAKLDLEETHYLSVNDVSLVRSEYSSPADLCLSPSVIKWVSYMQKEVFENLKKVSPSPQEKAEFWSIMQHIFSNLLHFPFKSEGFLLESIR